VAYIFINPDDGFDLGLLVIVEAKTGVIYANQVAGKLTDCRKLEGFLIPVGAPSEAKKLYDWFWRAFHGNCYTPEQDWLPETVKALARLVAEIPCWLTFPDEDEDKTQRLFLKLDEDRMGGCVEAWIPVITPYGKGILTLGNSD
jgi:hypothetical protein